MNRMLELLKAQVDKPCDPAAPPFTRWLDGIIREITRDSARVEYTARSEMTNPAGTLHGGVQCGMLDEGIGMLANAQGKKHFTASVNLSVDFLDKVSGGETISAFAKMVRSGSNILNVQGEIRAQDGRLIARAQSNLIHTTTPNPLA